MTKYIILIVFFLLSACAGKPLSVEDYDRKNSLDNFNYLNYEVVIQDDPYACGAAVLSAIFTYWGRPIDQHTILINTPPKGELGYSLAEMRDIAKAQGFNAFAIKANEQIIVKELNSKRPLVVALHLPIALSGYTKIPVFGPVGKALANNLGPRFNHYVTVVGISESQVLMADPVQGIKTLPREDFMAYWVKLNNASLVLALNK
jgi:predicted double-glycine peptidase